MSLGPLNSKLEKIEKEWDPEPSLAKYIYKIGVNIEWSEILLMAWLNHSKFYGAEYYLED